MNGSKVFLNKNLNKPRSFFIKSKTLARLWPVETHWFGDANLIGNSIKIKNLDYSYPDFVLF
jgi:hypothetical protein